MITLTITISLAAAAAVLNIWIATRVGAMRHKHKVSIGDGGVEALTARMRAHANFIEYMPIFLILVGLIELAEGSSLWLWIVAIAFVLARISHALGMDKAGSPLRGIGAGVSMLATLVVAIYAVTIPYRHGSLNPERIHYVAADHAATADHPAN